VNLLDVGDLLGKLEVTPALFDDGVRADPRLVFAFGAGGKKRGGWGEDECWREDDNTIWHSNHTSTGMLHPWNYKVAPRSAGKCRIRQREGQRDVRQ
jgi:hypothetical protein